MGKGAVPGWFYGIVITGLYFGYIFLGGLVFMILERPREQRICEEMTYQNKLVLETQRKVSGGGVDGGSSSIFRYNLN